MTASHITNEIYVGDLEDAKKWDGNILCVLEQIPDSEPEDAVCIPILKIKLEKVPLKDGNGNITTYENYEYVSHALIPQLDVVSHIIQNHVDIGEKLLVHCGAGQERSPLALTWYLHDRRGLSLEDAFKFVKIKRPQAINRLEWLSHYNFKKLNNTSDKSK